jgi:hypothetical protein
MIIVAKDGRVSWHFDEKAGRNGSFPGNKVSLKVFASAIAAFLA